MSVSVQDPAAVQPEYPPIPESGKSAVFDELAITVSAPDPVIVKLSGGTVFPTVTVSFVRPESVGATTTTVVDWADRDGDVLFTSAVSVISVPAVAFEGTPSVTLVVAVPPFAASTPASQLTELTVPEDDAVVHEPCVEETA